VPTCNCHLLSTQFDFLKVLACQTEEQKKIRLTSDSQDKLEIEKQTQVK
jgi:hypothetical protein